MPEQGGQGALALHYAAARGCLDCTKLLVQSGLTANTQMENEVTPVYLAAQEGHLEVLRYLVLEAGGSLYIRAKDGMAPVHAAAQMGSLPCLKWMVEEQGVDADLRDGDGATPLHFAASRGHAPVVRWLLSQGASLLLDHYGKSPINDAAENQQMECLNILVQHGTSPDYGEDARRQGKLHGCTCRTADPTTRCSYVDCVNWPREPFYLHESGLCLRESSGLYVNPGLEVRAQSSGSPPHPFYLHRPLGGLPAPPLNPLFSSPISVKVEVHAREVLDEEEEEEGREGRKGEDHDYEDIYLGRGEDEPGFYLSARSPRREEPPSLPHHSPESGLSSASPSELSHSEEEQEKRVPEGSRSLPHQPHPARALKRVSSEPGTTAPAPPPPPPPPAPEEPPTERSATGPGSESPPQAAKPRPEIPEPEVPDPEPEPEPQPETQPHLPPVVQHPPSGVEGTGGGGSLGTSTTPATAPPGAPLALRGFVPPRFVGPCDPEHLLKPSQYLASIAAKSPPPTPGPGPGPAAAPPPANQGGEREGGEDRGERGDGAPPPPPLPLPPCPGPEREERSPPPPQPLSAISIKDINSVQLRRTARLPAAKALSCPGYTENPLQAQREDLIAELKMSKDITGIKKLKVEKVKKEEKKDQEIATELSRQFSIEQFVEKMPEVDSVGNPIPVWKRQMLAKKAAEKARKELEAQLAREAEERRLMAIPPWKRHLMQAKSSTSPRSAEGEKEKEVRPTGEQEETRDKENMQPEESNKNMEKEKEKESEGEQEGIIPWRNQLRKTNSTLNLLE